MVGGSYLSGKLTASNCPLGLANNLYTEAYWKQPPEPDHLCNNVLHNIVYVAKIKIKFQFSSTKQCWLLRLHCHSVLEYSLHHFYPDCIRWCYTLSSSNALAISTAFYWFQLALPCITVLSNCTFLLAIVNLLNHIQFDCV